MRPRCKFSHFRIENQISVEKLFKTIWADHADMISIQYTGTGKKSREGRDNRLFITLVPKLYTNFYSYSLAYNLGTFIKLEYPNVLTNLQKGKYCIGIIIGYVHQFIGHCLFPLDPFKNMYLNLL